MTSLSRLVLFGVLLATAQAATPAFAEDAIIVGTTCPNLGASTMSSDQQNIVACLKNKSGNLVWKAMSGDGTPTGTVAYFALAGCPDGWTFANGSNNTVDLRGEFLRAWDGGRGLDAGRQLGTTQTDAMRSFNLSNSARVAPGGTTTDVYRAQINIGYNIGSYYQPGDAVLFRMGPDGGFAPLVPVNTQVAAENRPHNVALIVCQKN